MKKPKDCAHDIKTRRHGTYWWVCALCGASLHPESSDAG